MSAEYLAKKYIKDNTIKNIQVSSAGTIAHPEPAFSWTLDRLKTYWCDASKHKQRRISDTILQDQDFIICMAKHHQKTVKSLWYESILFNFVAYNKNEDVLDDAEYQHIHWPLEDFGIYVNEIVDYIHDAMPRLIEGLDGFEIERKFLIKQIPEDIKNYPHKKIIQWYFKDKNNKKIRIRKSISDWKTEYIQAIKKWHWLIRKENEINLTKENFDSMRKNVWNRYLEKTRYLLPYSWKTIELDIYEGKLKWLMTADIEFKTPLESRKFIVPQWFDKEVTEDRKFTNANLAKK